MFLEISQRTMLFHKVEMRRLICYRSSSVIHDSPLREDNKEEILNCRMSEVVVKKCVDLGFLSRIICRTVHEERTLRRTLGDPNEKRIVVEQKGAVFMRRGIFVDEIYWKDNLLYIAFHGPMDSRQETYELRITCLDKAIARQKVYNVGPGRYKCVGLEASKDANWRVEIERCLVYDFVAPSVSGLVSS